MTHPTLCDSCAKHVEESNLHWVQCGGMNVGLHKQPLVWRLRDRGENAAVKQRTEDLRKLAGAMRLLCQCHPFLEGELRERVGKFCNLRCSAEQ